MLARNGLIATSQPLAAAAGLRVFHEGGNAIDAAVTAAAVLSVIEPTMNGIGGDLFAIVHDGRTGVLRGLNASGRSAYAATPAAFATRHLARVPERGILSVSVPGVVDGWSELLATHGTIPLARALMPAIEYARSGFPLADIAAQQWGRAERTLADDPAAARTFLVDGRAPRAGEVFANPRLATSLERIANDGRDAFYRGPIAAAISADMPARGGLIDARDFADHRSDWVDPIGTTYRGYEVFELPPNTQGVTALEMLNILEGHDLRGMGHNSAEYLHLLVEAKRIAFADRDTYLADPACVPVEALRTLISKDYAARRRATIHSGRTAREYGPAFEKKGSGPLLPGRGAGDTVYLTAADRNGNVISLIQSIFANFGAGVVAGDTGIVLQNRASAFTLDATHPNVVAPHKRPCHTLIPAMVMKDGRPWVSFGVMGGDMQPQGHVQALLNLIDFGMNIQEAGEAARCRHTAEGVALESAISAEARAGLEARGHRLIEGVDIFGGFQGILIDPETGVLMGGSDPRRDGLAIGY